jgi:hypothetical protein
MRRRKSKEENYPGYPLYPASEDITSKAKRVPEDLEDIAPKGRGMRINNDVKDGEVGKPSIEGQPQGEFDVTAEDLEALGPVDLSMDLGEDEELKHRTTPVDFSGEDLDVPGTEDDDAAEEVGSEDEENNSYSIGGDRHEDLEDNNLKI